MMAIWLRVIFTLNAHTHTYLHTHTSSFHDGDLCILFLHTVSGQQHFFYKQSRVVSCKRRILQHHFHFLELIKEIAVYFEQHNGFPETIPNSNKKKQKLKPQEESPCRQDSKGGR